MPSIQRMLAMVLAVTAILGCTASMTSTKIASNDRPEDGGLLYFLPNKDIVVTVTIAKDKPPAIAITTTAAYPDAESPYYLTYNASGVGKNKLDVSVNSSGLLTSADAVTTSEIGQALSNLATAIAEAGPSPGAGSPKELCSEPGEYARHFDAAAVVDVDGPCGSRVTISRLAAAELAEKTHSYGPDNGAGFHYRSQLPYRVTVTGTTANARYEAEKIVLSPSQSATRFLPVEKTLFANNTSKIVFVDGIPTKYMQEVSGEVTAFLALPAEVIGAYFTAVGKIIARDKGLVTAENEARAAELNLAVANYKRELCYSALTAEDEKKIAEWCGK